MLFKRNLDRSMFHMVKHSSLSDTLKQNLCLFLLYLYLRAARQNKEKNNNNSDRKRKALEILKTYHSIRDEY